MILRTDVEFQSSDDFGVNFSPVSDWAKEANSLLWTTVNTWPHCARIYSGGFQIAGKMPRKKAELIVENHNSIIRFFLAAVEGATHDNH